MILMHFQKTKSPSYRFSGWGYRNDRRPIEQIRRTQFARCTHHEKIAMAFKSIDSFLDFDPSASNLAVMVNNYNWMKDFSLIKVFSRHRETFDSKLYDVKRLGQKAFGLRF